MKMLKYYKMIEMINKYGYNTVVIMSIAIILNIFVLYSIANIIFNITKDKKLSLILNTVAENYKCRNRKENHKKNDGIYYNEEL